MSKPHGHTHALPSTRNERSLRIALALTGSFLVVEVAGGILTGSLALLSDAAHMFTDVAALAIALAAIRVAKRPADARRTFGRGGPVHRDSFRGEISGSLRFRRPAEAGAG